LGQRDAVRVYRFVSRATVEERIVAVAKRKLCLEHVVVSGAGSKNLSRAELDDVLKYGASELFSGGAAADVDASRAERYGDGNTNKPEIKWDDDAVAALLHREPDQENEGRAATPVGEKNALAKLMDSFKVAEISFEETDEPPPEEEETDEKFEGWESLLKSSYDATQQKTQESLGKGKRERKQIKQGPVLVLDEEDDDLEDGDFHHVESDSDDSVEIDRPVASSIAKVAAKLERFGLPGGLSDGGVLAHERLEMGSLSDSPAATVKLCREALDECLRQKAEGYDASRDPFDGDRVLRRVGFFALVERKLRRRASEIPHSGVEFSRDITERYLNDTHVAWTPAHDARLLAAVCCHGYGHFADVALDESFDLVPPPTLRTAYGSDSEEDLREEYTVKDASVFYRSRVDRLERALAAEASGEKPSASQMTPTKATPVVGKFIESLTSVPCPSLSEPTHVEEDAAVDESVRKRWETIRNVVACTLKARKAYDENMQSATQHFGSAYAGRVKEAAPTSAEDLASFRANHAAARRCLERADDRLDAVLAAEAALDATRREVALADATPDPDALQMREKWQSQEWRRDDAKAEQRLRKIKELMKTDHVRRFAPLLTGQQAPEAPATG
jgi:hypothetical protein